uniref:SFRICE_005630 n=1 Tax=Spodoptera frugiperda TaxID=7108 RepID=A0A2H1V9B3_SPOFR
MAGTVDLDAILLELGQFGRYQIRNYCFILVVILTSAVYNAQYIFAAGDVPYRCKVPECEASPPQFEAGNWGTFALPDAGARCERLLPLGEECAPSSFSANETKRCQAWVYENQNTIVPEFDLACQEWQRTLVGTIHVAGVFASLPVTSHISDAYGRRTALVMTAVSPAIMGVIRAFSNSYVMYICFEFLEAFVGGGVYSTAFILALEMVGLDKRVLGGNLISSTFALGQVVTAGVSWLVPYWRTYTLVIYAPSIMFISYYWLIEESVRWLVSKGRNKEAARIIFKAAKMNRRKLSPETIRSLTEEPDQKKPTQSDEPEEPVDKRGILHQVVKSKTLMFRLTVCSFWWITLTFVYYGLSINSVSLVGNSYVNYILTSLVEIPGYCLSVLTLDRFGRKSSTMTAFIICGISLIAMPFVPESIPWLQTTLNLLGKLCISMAFSSIYIYTGELFPTQARHRLLGACSMAGRIGALVAPQTPLLMAYMESLPYLIFGIMAGTSGLLMMLTPETLKANLPDTVAQAENMDKKKTTAQ